MFPKLYYRLEFNIVFIVVSVLFCSDSSSVEVQGLTAEIELNLKKDGAKLKVEMKNCKIQKVDKSRSSFPGFWG